MSDRIESLTAAILAGGLGTRLRPVVGKNQKTIASVAGKPFLFYLLDQIASAGVKRVVILAGYRAGDVRSVLGTRYGDLTVTYSEEPSPLGTGGALRFALPALDSDPVLAMNGDSYCRTDLRSLWANHRASGANATLVVRRVQDTRQSGRVCFDKRRMIASFVEKGTGKGPGWINAGIYLLSRRLIESIPSDRPVSIEREIFPAWIGRGLLAHPTRGQFIDIGTPEFFDAAQRFFKPHGSLRLRPPRTHS